MPDNVFLGRACQLCAVPQLLAASPGGQTVLPKPLNHLVAKLLRAFGHLVIQSTARKVPLGTGKKLKIVYVHGIILCPCPQGEGSQHNRRAGVWPARGKWQNSSRRRKLANSRENGHLGAHQGD